MEEHIRMLIAAEEKALAGDDPKGTCAAHHRGAIAAYKLVLDLLASNKRVQPTRPEAKSKTKSKARG